MTTNEIREELYLCGVAAAQAFLKVNSISNPVFRRFADPMPEKIKIAQQLAENNPLVGGLSGFYRYGIISINVPVTALPVQQPRMRSWSYPCWKIDRTAVGVVAHETGHYVEEELRKAKILTEVHGAEWRELIQKCRKKVTGYEPKPSEAWAETLRVYILNPKLLQAAIPERYAFINRFITPSEQRPWKKVLQNHAMYCQAGERWIAA